MTEVPEEVKIDGGDGTEDVWHKIDPEDPVAGDPALETCAVTLDQCQTCSKTGETDLWIGVIEKGRTIPPAAKKHVLNLPYYRRLGRIGGIIPRRIENGTVYDLFCLRTCLQPEVFRLDERLVISFGTRRVWRPSGGWKMEALLGERPARKQKGSYVMRYDVNLTFGGRSVYLATKAPYLRRRIRAILRGFRGWCLLIEPSLFWLKEEEGRDVTLLDVSDGTQFVEPSTGAQFSSPLQYRPQISSEAVWISEMLPSLPFLCSKDGGGLTSCIIDLEPERMMVWKGRLYVSLEGMTSPEDAIKRGFVSMDETPYTFQFEALKERVTDVLEHLRMKNAVSLSESDGKVAEAWEMYSFLDSVWNQGVETGLKRTVYVTDWRESRIAKDLRPIILTGGDCIGVKLPHLRESNPDSLSDEEWLMGQDSDENERRNRILKRLIPGCRISDGFLFTSAATAGQATGVADTCYYTWRQE